jgi:raffinose/stachyose/melibiose transport system permease protein
MAAYGIGRMKWKLSGLTLSLLLTGLMIPIHSILVPLYITVSKFHLPNNVALLLIFIASTIPTSVFIIIGFLKGIPRTIEESAVIDGCSIPRVFISIICPMIKPAIATVTIFNFLAVWNDLMLSLIFLNEENTKTIQLGILRFQGAYFSDYRLLLSGIVVALIPSILVYLVMSEKLVNGVSAGAIKG